MASPSRQRFASFPRFSANLRVRLPVPEAIVADTVAVMVVQARQPHRLGVTVREGDVHHLAVPVRGRCAAAPDTRPRATAAALRASGGDVELVEYPGEGHRFDRAWPAMMHRAVTFLHVHLG